MSSFFFWYRSGDAHAVKPRDLWDEAGVVLLLFGAHVHIRDEILHAAGDGAAGDGHCLFPVVPVGKADFARNFAVDRVYLEIGELPDVQILTGVQLLLRRRAAGEGDAAGDKGFLQTEILGKLPAKRCAMPS